jgi:magnesium chelatase accessory protein
LLAAVFLLNESPNWDRDGRAWPRRELSRFVEAGGARFHVQRDGKGPQALLIHGAGASLHSFTGLAPHLAPPFETIAFDLPGHAFTKAAAGRRMTLDGAAAMTRELLDAIGAEPCLVVGHSAGAAIGIRMIASKRVAPRLFVGINGAFSPFEGPAGFLFPMMAKALHFNPFAPYLLAQSGRSRARVEALIRGTGSRIAAEGVDLYATLMAFPGHVAGALAMMANWDLTGMPSDLRAVTTRCLFLAGASDRAVPPEDSARAAAMAPNASHQILEGLGHLAHEEDPARIASLIVHAAQEAGAAV